MYQIVPADRTWTDEQESADMGFATLRLDQLRVIAMLE